MRDGLFVTMRYATELMVASPKWRFFTEPLAEWSCSTNWLHMSHPQAKVTAMIFSLTQRNCISILEKHKTWIIFEDFSVHTLARLHEYMAIDWICQMHMTIQRIFVTCFNVDVHVICNSEFSTLRPPKPSYNSNRITSIKQTIIHPIWKMCAYIAHIVPSHSVIVRNSTKRPNEAIEIIVLFSLIHAIEKPATQQLASRWCIRKFRKAWVVHKPSTRITQCIHHKLPFLIGQPQHNWSFFFLTIGALYPILSYVRMRIRQITIVAN